MSTVLDEFIEEYEHTCLSTTEKERDILDCFYRWLCDRAKSRPEVITKVLLEHEGSLSDKYSYYSDCVENTLITVADDVVSKLLPPLPDHVYEVVDGTDYRDFIDFN